MNAAISEKRARIVEVGLSMFAAIVTSALVNMWTLSAQLSKFQTKIEAHDDTLQSVSARLDVLQTNNSGLAAQVAVTEAHYADILRRLDKQDASQEMILTQLREWRR
jgi:septal ring factor EnvC (AmiA/AmiB activator)